MNRRNFQFSVRTLFVTTVLVALLIPISIRYYPVVMDYLVPPTRTVEPVRTLRPQPGTEIKSDWEPILQPSFDDIEDWKVGGAV